MRIVKENFEHLHFTECCLGEPRIDGSSMLIPVTGLYVMEGHPLSSGKGGPFKGRLVFKFVSESCRNISEYIGDSKVSNSFKEPRNIVDGPFVVLDSVNVQEYGFEGFLENPEAWINDWVVKSNSFEFECLE